MYPTKEEILAPENTPENIAADIEILCDWKDRNYKRWKDKSANNKLLCLEQLISKLVIHYSHPCRIGTADEPKYDPNTQTIFISNTKPSILSTLHEFGHHLYGESELKACAYSVWMFKMVFPKVYTKMKWDGHMLKM